MRIYVICHYYRINIINLEWLILISVRMDFRSKEYLLLQIKSVVLQLKVFIHQEDIILDVYVPNMRASKCMKQIDGNKRRK